jgi:hypothetical protein
MIKYNFYATLLDAFQTYLDSENTYNKYYSESDKYSCYDEFEEQCKQEFLNRLNRVPFVSESADKGTAFNAIVDYVNDNIKPNDMEFDVLQYNGCDLLLVRFNGQEFTFDKHLVLEVANKYKGAISQYKCKKTLPTKYGDVLLYGYIDELMPMAIHDIKTTGNYSAFKYRNNWQHIVYPYCIGNVTEFHYDIIVWQSGGAKLRKEIYNFDPERDIPKLTLHCEALIEFLDANRELITDKKIFNEQ